MHRRPPPSSPARDTLTKGGIARALALALVPLAAACATATTPSAAEDGTSPVSAGKGTRRSKGAATSGASGAADATDESPASDDAAQQVAGGDAVANAGVGDDASGAAGGAGEPWGHAGETGAGGGGESSGTGGNAGNAGASGPAGSSGTSGTTGVGGQGGSSSQPGQGVFGGGGSSAGGSESAPPPPSGSVGGQGGSGGSGPASGPEGCGFTTGAAPCDACLETSCCDASLSCAQSAACEAFNACLGQPGCGDGSCAPACAAAHPQGVSLHAALTTCLTSNCAAACGLPGGGGTGGAGAGGSSGTGAGGSSGTGAPPTLTPPMNDGSHGSGGPFPVEGAVMQAGGIEYRIIVPTSYEPAMPAPLLLVFSGVEGGATMTANLISVGWVTGIEGFVRAVIDGAKYNGNAAAGATVLDDVRARYNIDNDRTYLLGESAGTKAALGLGLSLRQSYFAAYWANDVNASASPKFTAAQLGFAPWGQAGPGGQFAKATAITDAMSAAGYRMPTPAPYAGAGASQHGSQPQFLAALSWFVGKSRH